MPAVMVGIGLGNTHVVAARISGNAPTFEWRIIVRSNIVKCRAAPRAARYSSNHVKFSDCFGLRHIR